MTALTFELLRNRAVALIERLKAEGHESQEPPWTRVVCDGCGLVIVLLDDPFPIGWVTFGDAEHGYRDYCPGCMQ